MAELRSTDIIGKLRKINQQIQNTNSRIDNLDGTNTDVASTQTVVYARVKNLTTNIDDYDILKWHENYILSNELREDSDEIFPGYKFYTITYLNNANGIDFTQATNFLGMLIGSKYLPKSWKDKDKNKTQPQYSYIIDQDQKIFLPIWREIGVGGELRMYLMYEGIANDITSLTDDQQQAIAPSVKAMKDYVESQSEVYIGKNKPLGDSYRIWVEL